MTEKKLQFKKVKDLAYTAIKKKDYQKGKELLEKAIFIEPNNAEVLNDLGLLDFNLNNLNKSIEYFKKAISINPNFSPPAFSKPSFQVFWPALLRGGPPFSCCSTR